MNLTGLLFHDYYKHSYSLDIFALPITLPLSQFGVRGVVSGLNDRNPNAFVLVNLFYQKTDEEEGVFITARFPTVSFWIKNTAILRKIVLAAS